MRAGRRRGRGRPRPSGRDRRTPHDHPSTASAPTRRPLRPVPAVRGFVGLAAAIGVVTALLVIAQAELLANTVARAFLGGAGPAELTVPLVALLGRVLG